MKKATTMFYLLAVFFVLAGCGGSGAGSCSFSTLETAAFNLDGTVWSLSGTTPSNDCPSPTTSFTGSGTFSQSGNTLTATSSGISLTGQISGSQVKFAGNLAVGTETITIDCTTATLTTNAVGSTFSYTGATWTSVHSSGSCSGTSNGTFTRTQ
ncbi:MAG: hypothetical protein HYV03_08490 [Deltaproteobacteria bacterium]|nr:hypothetical protein [Deltaproteobacteria bacterium]